MEAIITAPEELVLDLLDQTDAGCVGQDEGTLTLSSSGGSGGNIFIYQTDTLSGDTVTFTDLPAGTHTVAVYDLNDCNSELVIDIEENGEIVLDTISFENISCFEGINGMIEVLGIGGSGNYEYAINGGGYGPENIFANLESGDYTINVQDDSGCEGTLFFALSSPDEIIATIENEVNLDCFDSGNGAVDVVANGGSGIFEYTLGTETNTTGFFENLNAGNYDIVVVDEMDVRL